MVERFDLVNGLEAVARDCTTHYYGGYYNVCIEVNMETPVKREYSENESGYRSILDLLGETVSFCLRLEKMAVLEVDTAAARKELLDSFIATTLPYIKKVEFPRCLVLSRYNAALKKTLL